MCNTIFSHNSALEISSVDPMSALLSGWWMWPGYGNSWSSSCVFMRLYNRASSREMDNISNERKNRRNTTERFSHDLGKNYVQDYT